MVRIVPIHRLRIEVNGEDWRNSQSKAATNEGCNGNAVRSTAVQVFVVFDTSKIDDSIDERRLLGATVHQIRVRNLHRPSSSVVARD
jgi:hypothetical protein